MCIRDRSIADRPQRLVARTVIDEQPILDWLALAVVESVEEAVYNSMLMARTVVGLSLIHI